MAEHFRMEVIQGGNWRRCQEQSAEAARNEIDQTVEPRLHAIPLTRNAQAVAIAEAAKWVKVTGLCPGEIKQGDEWIVAYRFVRVVDSDHDALLDDVDKLLNEYIDRCRTINSEDVLAAV